MTIRKSLNELNILGNMSSKFPCNSEANTSELHENLEDTFTGVKCLVWQLHEGYISPEDWWLIIYLKYILSFFLSYASFFIN